MKKGKNRYIFLMILIGLLLSACTNHGNSEASESTNTSESGLHQEQVATPEIGIDLYGTYDQNDLLIETLEKEYQGITLEIPQISGLKDKKVQEKINRDIRQSVELAYADYTQLEFVMYGTLANFSNVLSIGVYIGGGEVYEQVYLNYNLLNGERLTFEELFLSDTDTLEIIRNAFRDMLIKDQMQGNYNENELYKMVKGYSESDDKVFAFTPTSILLCYKDYIASVKMLDIAEEIAIYTKYVTEDSLYERNDIGKKGVFTCVDVLEIFDIWEYGLLEDNLWYDLVIPKDFYIGEAEDIHFENYEKLKENMYAQICTQLEAYREMARNNPEHFYVVLIKANIYMEMESVQVGDGWFDEYTGNAVINKNIQTLEMPQQTYDKIYKDKIMDGYRYEYFGMQGGLYLEVTEDDVVVEEEIEEMRYNYITGK